MRRLHAELEIFGWRRILNRHIGGEPTIADADVAMLEIAGFDQAAPERVNDVHELPGDSMLKNPITGIAGCCCAPPASGHADAPPSSVMNAP